MASFISTRPGGNHPILHKLKPKQTFNHVVTLPYPIKKRGQQLIVGSMAIKSSNPPSPLLSKKDLLNPSQDSIFQERLEKWMEQSAEDIVKNIKQAPLLVQIYDGDNKGSKPNLKTEKAILENWEVVKSEWENGECESPNGLIFVEEIEDDAEVEVSGEEVVTKSWGIVVQGRGMECVPACYLLKTSRVRAGLGLGMFCTHFCLMRVQSFNQSALSQFKDSWLCM